MEDQTVMQGAINVTNETSEYYEHDVSSEEYREVVFPSGFVYRINNPVTLVIRAGGSTHRVVDADGVVHMYPFGGEVVVRWRSRNTEQPISF